MELAITVDAMEPFAKVTYTLEGDGALAVTTYAAAEISTEHYPNVNAVASELAASDATRERQLVAYAKACVQLAYRYLKTIFLMMISSQCYLPLKPFGTSHLQRYLSYNHLRLSLKLYTCDRWAKGGTTAISCCSRGCLNKST